MLPYKEIEQTVREAGKMILSAHVSSDTIMVKEGEMNFVTAYDVAVQEFLTRELSELVPGCAFCGEEDTEQNSGKLSDGYTFIIDPIDGTTNFMFDYHLSCVSVGLALDGKMAAAWVYQPYYDHMATAVRGQGAYLNGRKLELTDKALKDGILAFSCARYHAIDQDLLFRSIQASFNQAMAVRLGGSAAWDITRVATGSNVVYVEFHLSPWDYAAASLLVEEAGGIITQLDGSPISLAPEGCSILAGTKQAYADYAALLKEQEALLQNERAGKA